MVDLFLPLLCFLLLPYLVGFGFSTGFETSYFCSLSGIDIFSLRYRELYAFLLVRVYVLVWMLTLCMLGNFSSLCCRLPSFLKLTFLRNSFHSVTLSECQTVWIQIRTDRMSKLFAKVISR